tara:strand:+ start:2659 stop:2961 length:303 start_codon:yes stop_codon:yes gene_type:complete
MDSDLIDMIVKNESPAEVHTKIKDILYAKSHDNIETITPAVSASLFGGPNPYLDEPETDAEVEAPEAETEVEVSDEEPAEVEAEAEVQVGDNTEEEQPEA